MVKKLKKKVVYRPVANGSYGHESTIYRPERPKEHGVDRADIVALQWARKLVWCQQLYDQAKKSLRRCILKALLMANPQSPEPPIPESPIPDDPQSP